MSVVSVTKAYEESSHRTLQGVDVTYTWYVLCDSEDDGPDICYTAVDPVSHLTIPSGLASIVITVSNTGNYYSGVSGYSGMSGYSGGFSGYSGFVPNPQPVLAALSDTSIERDPDLRTLRYKVKCTFSYNAECHSPPTQDKWNIDFKQTNCSFEQEVNFGYSGTSATVPITNSAAKSFKPGLKETYYDKEISILYNTYTPPISAIDSALGTINSSTLNFTVIGQTFSYPAKTIKVIDGLCDPVYGGDLTKPYWKVSLKFRYRRDTWVRKVLDEGEIDIDNKAIRDANGEPVSSPVWLDGSGHKSTSTTTPNWLSFTTVATSDFSALFTGIS